MKEDLPSSVKPWKRWLTLVLICIGLIAGLAGLKYQQIQESIAFAASFPERSATVTAVTAKLGSWTQVYRTIGEVRATRFVELRNEVEGRITAIGFIGGDSVAAGQTLLQLDSREETAQLDATRAELKLAELKLQRIIELRKDKMASPEDYDNAAASKAVLVANLAALTARIEKLHLVAPFDAKTNLHALEIGQYVSANSLITGLTGNDEELWIDFDLPQDKSNIEIGTNVTLSGLGIKGNPLIARVISSEPQIDVNSRTRGYRALLALSETTLSPGAVVDVAVETGIMNNVIRLPATAVRLSDFGAFVYILEKAEAKATAPFRAIRRQVSVSRAEGEQVIITQGLAPGDLVAALGAFKLQEGLLVHVVERLSKEAQMAAKTQ
jgi:membrane fusion protein (multidrug efflux system)